MESGCLRVDHILTINLNLKTQDLYNYCSYGPFQYALSPRDPSKRMLICTFNRDEQVLNADAYLDESKTYVIWDLECLGGFHVSIDTFEINRTKGLSPEECELLISWTKKGLEWLQRTD
jgi:hypothetical protein